MRPSRQSLRLAGGAALGLAAVAFPIVALVFSIAVLVMVGFAVRPRQEQR